MLNFITLNVSSKLTTSIHKNAFIDAINSIQNKVENIKINVDKTDIEILHNGKNIIVSLEIKTKNNTNLSLKINEIKEKIETHCHFLMDQKPINIIINHVGTY